MKHKHYDCIVAWANGAEIEWRASYNDPWQSNRNPSFLSKYEYRVKPEPKPDEIRYMVAKNGGIYLFVKFNGNKDNNLKLTFDGDTGKLKSAEVMPD